MANFKQIDLSKVKTISIKKRKSKVRISEFAKLYNPHKQNFSDFIDSLPNILIAKDLRLFVEDIARSFNKNKPVIAMFGAHVIKVGLSPLIIDLIKNKIVTAVAMNSAASIHDVELAMWGITSEDVEEMIETGMFGMSKETGELINHTLKNSLREQSIGYGGALGKVLQTAPYRKLSVLATCYKLGVPCTVHASIGTDIIHQQPSMDGAVTGELTFRDFKIFCNVIKDLQGGGVVMNFGSAVILPEVFLKALSVSRNLGYPTRGFTTANFDMIQHYRPRLNIVQRPTRNSGRGFLFTGHHEVMIPLLCAMIKSRLNF